MNVLLVEDEITAARGLRKMLAEIDPNIHVLAHLVSVQDTVAWLSSHNPPDLIFLDIQLKDGLSFDIFKEIDCLAPIIFCTAFDHYALEAFKLNSIDYLLKPYHKEELEIAIKKFRKISGRGQSIDYRALARSISEFKVYKDRFLVKAGRKFYHISVDQIACFYTHDKVNFIRTVKGKQYVVDEYLDKLEGALNPAHFFRINRQSIVAVWAIDSVENDHGKYSVKLGDADLKPMTVSRSRISELKKWLGQTGESDRSS